MAIEAKIQGTRYVLNMHKNSSNVWNLDLLVKDALEDSIELKDLNMRFIKEGVHKLIDDHKITVNPILIENIIKSLYQQSTGDVNMAEHDKNMQELSAKQNMMNDPSFTQSLVSEFNKTFNKQENTPQKEIKQNKPHPKPPEKPMEIKEQQVSKSGLADVVSEMGKKMEDASQSQYGGTKVASHLTQQYNPVNTAITATDVNDLITELIEEQNALKGDIAHLTQRVEKIDRMLLKLSSLKF